MTPTTNWREMEAGWWLDYYIQHQLELNHRVNWSWDLNAAFALPLLKDDEPGAAFQLERYGTTFIARVATTVSARLNEASPEWETADSAALACCRAWLAWKERHS